MQQEQNKKDYKKLAQEELGDLLNNKEFIKDAFDKDFVIEDYARVIRIVDEYKVYLNAESPLEMDLVKPFLRARNNIKNNDLSPRDKRNLCIPDDISFIAFNRAIAKNLNLKFPEGTDRTNELFQSGFDKDLEKLLQEKEKIKQQEEEKRKQQERRIKELEEQEKKKYEDLGVDYKQLEPLDKMVLRTFDYNLERTAEQSIKTAMNLSKEHMDKLDGNQMNKDDAKSAINAYIAGKMIQKNRKPIPWYRPFRARAAKREAEMLDQFKQKIVNLGIVTNNELDAYEHLSNSFFEKKVNNSNLPEAKKEKQEDLQQAKKPISGQDLQMLKGQTIEMVELNKDGKAAVTNTNVKKDEAKKDIGAKK